MTFSPRVLSAHRSYWAMIAVVTAVGVAAISLSTRCAAGDSPDATALFNGRDLSGWKPINTAPDTWQVRDGMIVCTGRPRGFIRTERMYENFILELEWRHVEPGGNAGLFVFTDALPQIGAPYPHSIEIQVMDGDHGSMFPIRGCTATPITRPKGNRAQPIEDRCRPAGEWNRYVVTAHDGNLDLDVNGNVVSRLADASQVRGYIALESEGSEVHFRNIRIRELPSSNPPAERIGQADDGLVSLFDGLTFTGWRHPAALDEVWSARDGIIRLSGTRLGASQDDDLWTEREYGDFIMVVDWRLPRKPRPNVLPTFTPDGLFRRDADGKTIRREILDAGDSGVYLRGGSRSQVNIWCQPMGSGDINAYHKDATLSVDARRACVPATRADREPGAWNRFVITMRGDRVSVTLNGQEVIRQARLPDVAGHGPLALQNHGDPVEFRNLFIKPLD